MFAACCCVLFCLSLLLPVNNLTFQRLRSRCKRGSRKKNQKSEELIVLVKKWVHYAYRNYMIGLLCKFMPALTNIPAIFSVHLCRQDKFHAIFAVCFSSVFTEILTVIQGKISFCQRVLVSCERSLKQKGVKW